MQSNSSQRVLINELAPAQMVEQVFMISQPVLRTTNRGDYYIGAFLSDRTGRINSRMWQASEAIYESLPQEGFVWVRGRTETYQNALQIVVESIRPIDSEEVDLDDFMPSTEKDVDEMFGRVKEILSAVTDPFLSELIEAFLNDEKLMTAFMRAPAAITLHHAFLGGLLEHTLSLMELGRVVLPCYPQLHSDLVITALFLHDIGKTTELEYGISFQYSDEGHLMGHLVKSVILVQEKIRVINESHRQTDGKEFPILLAGSLEHILLSHHGSREFGCPVVPSTPEAFVVHYLDNLDSKVALTFSQIEKDVNKGNWTHYIKAIESPLFKLREFE